MGYDIIDYSFEEAQVEDGAFLNISLNHNKYLKNKIKELSKRIVKGTDIQIPGFRSKNAPIAMIIERYGKNRFFDFITFEVVNYLTKMEGLLVACYMDLREVDYESNKKFDFRAFVEILPEVDVEDKYVGIELPKLESKISEEEIDSMLDNIMKSKRSHVVKEDGDVSDGDFVVFEYMGTVDGKPYDGNEGKTSVVIGAKLWPEDFENQMIGKKESEEFVIEINVPEDFHNKDMAGKDIEFKINICSISEVRTPDLDVSFAKQHGCPTVEALREKIEESIKVKKDQDNENVLYEVVESFILDNYDDVNIPNTYFENEVTTHITSHDNRLKSQKATLDDWLRGENIGYADYEKMIKERLRKAIKIDIILKNLSIKEKIEVTDEEIAECEKQYGMHGSPDMSDLKSYLRRKKSMELILEKGKYVEDNSDEKSENGVENGIQENQAEEKQES